MFKFELGARVKDVVTGFEGVVMARTEFLNKCIRYGVQSSSLDKDGRVMSNEHFDEEQLVAAGEPVQLPVHKTKRTGGPHDAPTRAKDITR